jgi:hypothetical protein
MPFSAPSLVRTFIPAKNPGLQPLGYSSLSQSKAKISVDDLSS